MQVEVELQLMRSERSGLHKKRGGFQTPTQVVKFKTWNSHGNSSENKPADAMRASRCLGQTLLGIDAEDEQPRIVDVCLRMDGKEPLGAWHVS